jgi:hypothetical protein
LKNKPFIINKFKEFQGRFWLITGYNSKNLWLHLLERFGREVYVSWFEPLNICLEGGISVFKANNEFVKVKVEEKCGQALKRACGGFGLSSEIVVDV